ncbi:MAG: hypothetical protein H7174_05585, partial [Flavobacterium sp.]|nr:hypothetical protein [Flavobacterium sp.]
MLIFLHLQTNTTVIMKKLYFTVVAFLFMAVANAQIINIPDANFKAKLLAADNNNYRLTYIKNTYIYSKYKDMESIFQGENILEF